MGQQSGSPDHSAARGPRRRRRASDRTFWAACLVALGGAGLIVSAQAADQAELVAPDGCDVTAAEWGLAMEVVPPRGEFRVVGVRIDEVDDACVGAQVALTFVSGDQVVGREVIALEPGVLGRIGADVASRHEVTDVQWALLGPEG